MSQLTIFSHVTHIGHLGGANASWVVAILWHGFPRGTVVQRLKYVLGCSTMVKGWRPSIVPSKAVALRFESPCQKDNQPRLSLADSQQNLYCFMANL